METNRIPTQIEEAMNCVKGLALENQKLQKDKAYMERELAMMQEQLNDLRMAVLQYSIKEPKIMDYLKLEEVDMSIFN